MGPYMDPVEEPPNPTPAVENAAVMPANPTSPDKTPKVQECVGQLFKKKEQSEMEKQIKELILASDPNKSVLLHSIISNLAKCYTETSFDRTGPIWRIKSDNFLLDAALREKKLNEEQKATKEAVMKKTSK